MRLQESGEMYLESIYRLSLKSNTVRSVDISEYMGYSKPSVSRAVNLLKNGGYIAMDGDNYITLTDTGREIAEKIYNYSEVQSLYLMSGAYDLAVFIEGKTMKEVAYFVAQKLAPIDSVVSTATHFVLRKYKDKGVVYGAIEEDLRGNEF